MTGLTERKIGKTLSLQNYRSFNPGTYGRILRYGKKLSGKTVLHINSTPQGGGVAELLSGQVALERSLGLRSRWFYITAPKDFFRVTKKIHNLLQGQPGALSFSERMTYLSTSQELGRSLAGILRRLKPDVVVLHDPQPLAMVLDFPGAKNFLLRLHIDLSDPSPHMLEFFKAPLNEFARVVVSSKYFKKNLPPNVVRKTSVIMPAIDPLSSKNCGMPQEEADAMVQKFGIGPNKPIVSQISRFDPWKDPLGVVEAYLLAKQEVPDLQLVLCGIMNAADDAEAQAVYQKVKKRCQGIKDIFLFSSLSQIKGLPLDRFVNAMFTASDVVLQKSLREGFGLTVTEAMWKGKSVIGGNARGIRLQIQNGKNGLIVSSVPEAARAIVKLLESPRLRDKLGRAAKKTVAQNFLLPRFLLENLSLYQKLM